MHYTTSFPHWVWMLTQSVSLPYSSLILLFYLNDMGMEASSGILIDVSISPSKFPGISPAGKLKDMGMMDASSGISISPFESPVLLSSGTHEVTSPFPCFHALAFEAFVGLVLVGR